MVKAMNGIRGLSSNEVLKSRKDNGSNEITHYKRNTIISLIIESLNDPIIKILLVNPLWSFHNYPPLNLIELATYLIKNGFKHTKILDLNYKIKK